MKFGSKQIVRPLRHDLTVIETPEYLSPSSSATFDGCALKWKFKYVDRLPDPSGQAALVGSFVHLVLEHLCQLPNKLRTKDQAKLIAKELWPTFELEEDYTALELNEAEARAFRWQSWIATEGLWSLEDPADVEVVSTEQKVKTNLNGVPFKGIVDRVDRINGELVISDYKSGKLPGSRWRNDKIQQVMLYAAAIAETGDETPTRARLLYLGQRSLEVSVTERRLEKSKEELGQIWENVQAACTTEDFEPKPSVLCGWCSFVESCPAGQKEIDKRFKAGKMPGHAPALKTLEYEVHTLKKVA